MDAALIGATLRHDLICGPARSGNRWCELRPPDASVSQDAPLFRFHLLSRDGRLSIGSPGIYTIGHRRQMGSVRAIPHGVVCRRSFCHGQWCLYPFNDSLRLPRPFASFDSSVFGLSSIAGSVFCYAGRYASAFGRNSLTATCMDVGADGVMQTACTDIPAKRTG